MMQNNVNSTLKKGRYGRDHHPHAFTMWMAGAGIKPGVYGETDDIGYYITENPVGIRDLQATILNQVGLDPHRFSFSYQGSIKGSSGLLKKARLSRVSLPESTELHHYFCK